MNIKIESDKLKLEFEGNGNEFAEFLNSINPTRLSEVASSLSSSVAKNHTKVIDATEKITKNVADIPAEGKIQYRKNARGEYSAITDWKTIFGAKQKLTKKEMVDNFKHIYNVTEWPLIYARLQHAINKGKIQIMGNGNYRLLI
jgi:hypothetical protein